MQACRLKTVRFERQCSAAFEARCHGGELDVVLDEIDGETYAQNYMNDPGKIDYQRQLHMRSTKNKGKS